jgi:OFA family oxalate/formate antiporter-like MFS transporter
MSTPLSKEDFMEENLGNRWRFVFAALVMQICLGILYAWSVFRPPLQALNGWDASQAGMPYNFSLLFFTVGMIIAGFWQDKKGPRLVGSVGGVFLGLGCILASFMVQDYTGLVFAYGVLGGLGVGFAYVTPIATCVKWFPDKRGTIVGLAVLGFGAGSLIFGPVLEGMMGLEALKAKLAAGGSLLNNPELAGNIKGTFLTIGLAFLVFVIGAAQFYKVPPAGYRPPGWNPPTAAGPATKEQFNPGEMLRTWQFYVLWLLYFLGAAVGLVAIGQAKPLITPAYDSATKAGAWVLTGGWAVGIMAAFNGVGRLAWGSLSDKIGRNLTTFFMFCVYILASLLLIFVGVPQTAYLAVLASLCFIGFAYGGYLAMLPAFTADYYGASKVGTNYGILFTAWGISGMTNNFYLDKYVIKPAIANPSIGFVGGYQKVFWILTVMAVIGAALALLVKRPIHHLPAAPK